MSKKYHHAFKVEYSALVSEIVTLVAVGHPVIADHANANLPNQYRAIWDTGANGSVITRKIVDDLKLIPVDKIEIKGVNNVSVVDTHYISIGLPNKVLLPNVIVSECNLNSPGIDLLIGMDIILLGDFSVSNPNNKTIFSFCIPPHDNPVDLVEKSERVNRRKN